jgi:hypothetical protein
MEQNQRQVVEPHVDVTMPHAPFDAEHFSGIELGGEDGRG